MTNVDIVIPTLFQRKPERGHRTQHGRSWKNLCGHDANMNALRWRHAKNSELVSYKLAGTINILKDLTIEEIKQTWAKIVRKFGENDVVLWWIREVSRRTNRIHYHTITASDHTGDELKDLIRSACTDLKFRLQFEPCSVETIYW